MLADPPQVTIGNDDTWHQTEWDETTTAEAVGRGRRKMSPYDQTYQHWTISVDGGAAQVFRLLVHGPLMDNPGVGSVTVPVGRSQTRVKVTDTPEVIIVSAGHIECAEG